MADTRGPKGQPTTDTKKSAAAITQWEAVYRTATNTVAKTSATGTQAPYGIAAEKATAAGEYIQIITHGDAYAIASAAIVEGATLMPDSSGQVTTHTTGKTVIGTARGVATAAGDIIAITVNPGPATATS